MLKHWGLERMAKHEHDESIDEMKHADALIERVLIARRPAEPAGPGQADDRRERRRDARVRPEGRESGQVHLKDAIAYCETVRDYVSRELFERHPRGHRGEHIDFLETQLDLVEQVGEQNYLQSQMKTPS